mmetsp:Transcript_25434/g.79252  ORF Transcript_25434/g.79252 Transcript_25434/m.79252 type:complete len:373 (+) Transcript_25434:79-1197(+)
MYRQMIPSSDSSSMLHGSRAEEGRYILKQLNRRGVGEQPMTISEQDFQGTHTLVPGRWPRDAYVWFNLENITLVDTIAQQFEVVLVHSVRWKEDSKENVNVQEGDARWKLASFGWHPQVKWSNMLTEQEERREEWFRVYTEDMQPLTPSQYVSNAPSTVWVRQFRRQRATFSETMLLHPFPFDVQRLRMTLTSSWDCSRVLLRFDDRDRCASMVERMTHIQEWRVHAPLLIAYDRPDALYSAEPLLSNAIWSRTGARYSRLHIVPIARRQAMPALVNVFSIQGVLTSMVFMTFQIPKQDLADRLSVAMTLVLASVAFKLTVATEIPKVPYITWLDKYLLASFAFLVAMCFEHFVAAYYSIEDCGHLTLMRCD